MCLSGRLAVSQQKYTIVAPLVTFHLVFPGKSEEILRQE